MSILPVNTLKQNIVRVLYCGMITWNFLPDVLRVNSVHVNVRDLYVSKY